MDEPLVISERRQEEMKIELVAYYTDVVVDTNILCRADIVK